MRKILWLMPPLCPHYRAVLVSRQGSFASVPDLLTPAPFNHVVIAVPMGGDYAFIDPATIGLPTGRLPGAFAHPVQGDVDALVMFQQL